MRAIGAVVTACAIALAALAMVQAGGGFSSFKARAPLLEATR